jgi:predicted P-loop ATPase
MESAKFKSVPKELARHAAVLVAEENKYDSAQLWLRGIMGGWDGVRRIDTFLVDFFGCPDTPYTRAVSAYIWTALAGRVLSPGCQADMAPVLEGDQGIRKTSAIAAMVPAPEFFVEVDFQKDDTETARLLRGVLVAEINELRGLHTRDQESIKAFVSRRWEKWTPKYKEFATTFARRAVLFGTTNRTDILADDTGNRRWLPIHVVRADVEGIVRARDQLWAEGAVRFGAGGVAWHQAEKLAAPEHTAYMIDDEWDGIISKWLNSPDLDGAPYVAGTVHQGFTMGDVLRGALGLTVRDMSMTVQKRAGASLKRLGFEKKHTKGGNSWFSVENG